jgi:hypothetical protein
MNRGNIEPSLNYSKVAIMPSLRCDANCRHCLFLPEQRRGSKYNSKFVLGVINKLPKNIIHVSITGGEPFFNISDLFEVVKEISKKGLEFSIVTNGLWFRREDSVINIIKKIKAMGATGITLSFDEYHQPRLSEKEINEFIMSVAKCGIRVGIKSCGNKMKKFIERTRLRFKKERIPVEIEFFSLERVGTASNCNEDRLNRKINNSCKLVGTPLIFSDGTVFACCSLLIMSMENEWLIRGNAKSNSIDNILSLAEKDFRLLALAAMGPAGLAKVVGVKPKKDETSCELCVRILNNADYRKELEERLQKDKRLRQEVVGRFLVLSYRLYQKEKQEREKWREYFRRIGVEK